MTKLLIAVLCLAVAFNARAAVFFVESDGTQADVEAVIAAASSSASDVTIIRVPLGSFAYTSTTVQVNKRIIITGWHKDDTFISHPTTTANRIFLILNAPIGTNLMGFANMTLSGNSTASSFGLLSIGNTSGAGKTNHWWRVHDVNFVNIGNRGIQTIGTSMGLIDHCHFAWSNTNGNQQHITVGTANYWESNVGVNVSYSYDINNPTNFVYLEDNTSFAAHSGDSTMEIYNYRACARFNSWTNSSLIGAHENGDKRTPSIYLIYGNSWLSKAGQVLQIPGDFRSGWGLMASNTLLNENVGAPEAPQVSVYRATGTNVFAHYYPYSTVATAPSPPETGTTLAIQTAYNNRFDKPTFPQVAVIWPAGQVPGGTNFELATVTAKTPGNPLLTITRGSPARAILVGDQISLTNFLSVTGTNALDGNLNTNVNEYGYPAFEQPGYGDPTTFTATNCIQTLHGIYQWSNTFNGSLITLLQRVSNNDGLTGADGVTLANTVDLVQEGRDYFDNTVHPTWTPVAYPHFYRTVATVDVASTNVVPSTSIDFEPVGGSGNVLIWEFYQNQSGGTLNSATGEYTAGNSGNVDIIRYMDSHANYAYSTIAVDESPPPGGVAPGYSGGVRRRIM